MFVFPALAVIQLLGRRRESSQTASLFNGDTETQVWTFEDKIKTRRWNINFLLYDVLYDIKGRRTWKTKHLGNEEWEILCSAAFVET